MRRTVQIIVVFQLLNLLGGHIDAVVEPHNTVVCVSYFLCRVPSIVTLAHCLREGVEGQRHGVGSSRDRGGDR